MCGVCYQNYLIEPKNPFFSGVLNSGRWSNPSRDKGSPGRARNGVRQQVTGTVYIGWNPTGTSRCATDRSYL